MPFQQYQTSVTRSPGGAEQALATLATTMASSTATITTVPRTREPLPMGPASLPVVAVSTVTLMQARGGDKRQQLLHGGVQVVVHDEAGAEAGRRGHLLGGHRQALGHLGLGVAPPAQPGLLL